MHALNNGTNKGVKTKVHVMKLTDKWLKEFLIFDDSNAVLAQKLTSLGLEVEDIQDWPQVLDCFKVAEITHVKKHPDADRLSICTVQMKDKTSDVVCSAVNVRAGLKVIFAPIGTTIPKGNFRLKKTTIRGIESCGMICSFEELGLDAFFVDKEKSIAELPKNASVDQTVAEVLGLDEVVFSLGITPDRPDFMGVLGIARELAASGFGILKPFEAPALLQPKQGPLLRRTLNVDASSQKGCPLFALAAFENVQSAAALPLIQKRLRLLGVGSINAPVDITNYVTQGYCRPLHVFDADKIEGDICVRYATKGETFVALNGQTYHLTSQDIVIADERGVLSLGGVMGGMRASVTAHTQSIYLEAALFDPIHITRTARRLSLVTDAALRFERGVDRASVVWGMNIATMLLCGTGMFKSYGYVTSGEMPISGASFNYDPSLTKILGGLTISAQRQIDFLQKTGFAPKQLAENTVKITPPSWRFDIEAASSIAEDMLRLEGYHKIPFEPLPPILKASDTGVQKTLQTPFEVADVARVFLTAKGFSEAVTWSFIESEKAASFAPCETLCVLKNPISSEMSTLRPSLLPGLLDTVSWHQRHRVSMGCGMFEYGVCHTFDTRKEKIQNKKSENATEDKPEGRCDLVIVIPPALEVSWRSRERDVWQAKGTVLSLLKAFGLQMDVDVRELPENLADIYHPGLSGILCVRKQKIATFGALHPHILKTFSCVGPVFVAEINMSVISALKVSKKTLAISPYQVMTRDLGINVPQDLTSQELTKAIKCALPQHLEKLEIFDVFQDESLHTKKEKALAFRLYLRPEKQGETDAFAEELFEKALDAVKVLGAQLRRDAV